uniref:Alpha/beta hydrolase fold-3 domain-containing protein n=1 Tax=Salvator merianae TaxID=96440 RepID=A0A8D0BUD7_SALMN
MLLTALFLDLVGLLFIACLVLAIWAVYFHFSKSEVPSGVCQPLKLRFLHIDYILYKMGFFSRYTLVRLGLDGFSPFCDPTLSTRMTFFDGVCVRIYRPKEMPAGLNRGIMFFHGGCGLVGSIDSHDRLCRYISKQSHSVVVSVEYHLAPEYSHPTLFTECQNATVHFMRNAETYGVDPARIILGGDSIGGTVVAHLSQELSKRTELTRIRAQVLLYPFLQALDFHLPSHQQNRCFPIISQEQCIIFAMQYFNKVKSLVDLIVNGSFVSENTKARYSKWVNSDRIPREFKNRNPKEAMSVCSESNPHKLMKQVLGTIFSPLLSDDDVMKDVPEAFILTCEYDIFRDDGILYKQRLEENGVPVSFCNLEDGFHACLVLINHWLISFPSAKNGLDHVVNYIRGL